MRKSIALEYFKELYDATFDDTITYIYGKTGNPDLLNDVLYSTYSELFIFIKKLKWYDEEQVSNFFYNCLNDMIGEFAPPEAASPREIAPSQKEDIELLLDTEFDIDDEQAVNNLLIKKAHSFVLQKSAVERKIFVLYFYKGFEPTRISGLLGVDASIVNGCVATLLTEIKDNFLSSYLAK